MKWMLSMMLLAGITMARPVREASTQEGALQAQFGAQGLQTLTYKGQVLQDLAQWPEDRFHIWHMSCMDANGHLRTDGQYGWGENNQGRTWDGSTRTWMYRFVWGSIRVQYVPRVTSLDIVVTESNRAESGVTLEGASIYPVTLHPPSQASGGRVVDGMQQPVVVSVTWSDTQAVVVGPRPEKAVYAGFEPGTHGGLAMIASGTRPDSVPAEEGGEGRSVRPGQTDSLVVSLRFGSMGAPLAEVAGDAVEQWAALHPMKLNWSDRRIVGTVYLASAGAGEKTQPAGFPTNPRRYFNDPAIDVTTPRGLLQFQRRILDQAETVVANLRKLNSQGAITWDIEGEQFPHDTSYVCSPDQIAAVSPEMESVLPPGERFAGMKLDDAYFRIIRDAGFRVGVCVRPQHFALAPNGRAGQSFLPDTQAARELIGKMKYAHDRWGATIFYVDSTVRQGGWPLSASVLEQAAAALPDSLLIPEESTLRMFATTAPFLTFLFHGDVGIDSKVRTYYPGAFAVNLVNDADPSKLAQSRADLVRSVRHGDILMVHAGYWQANNPAVLSIYRDAGRGSATNSVRQTQQQR